MVSPAAAKDFQPVRLQVGRKTIRWGFAPKPIAKRSFDITGSTAAYGQLAEVITVAEGLGMSVGRPRELTEAQEQAILRLRARGESGRSIARTLGVGREQVRRLLAPDTKPLG